MKSPDWLRILTASPRQRLPGGVQLRLLTAQEVLEARREATALAGEDRDRALCSNACLLAQELAGMNAGLKVLAAGIKDRYDCDFISSDLSLFAWAEGELFRVYISFYLPNTMDGDDTAELNCTLTGPELKALIEDLDQACARFPERK